MSAADLLSHLVRLSYWHGYAHGLEGRQPQSRRREYLLGHWRGVADGGRS